MWYSMAFARVVQGNLRRTGGAIGSFRYGNHVNFGGIPADSFSFSSFESVPTRSDFSNRLPLSKISYACNWSRGIKTTPHDQFPVAERALAESDSEYDRDRYPGLEPTKPGEKPRVVVLGTGWAACRFMKGLDVNMYDIVCISPRNHMVFTPLLASTCVGTLEFRSVAEPVNRIQPALAATPNSYFYLASCNGVDTDKHEVS